MNQLIKQLNKCYREDTTVDIYINGITVFREVKINSIDDLFIKFSIYEIHEYEQEVKQFIKTYMFRTDCINGLSYTSSELLTSNNININFIDTEDDFTELM